MLKYTAAAFLSFCLLGMTLITPPKNNPKFEGAWKITQIITVQAGGRITSVKPLESLVLFTQGYYSFSWTSHKSSAKTWQIADSERVARFNQTLINAGTFELDDSTLTTHAQFALAPKFVGGSASFKYRFSGDTLVLTGINVLSSDKNLHPIYAGGSHIVNKLVRIPGI